MGSEPGRSAVRACSQGQRVASIMPLPPCWNPALLCRPAKRDVERQEQGSSLEPVPRPEFVVPAQAGGPLLAAHAECVPELRTDRRDPGLERPERCAAAAITGELVVNVAREPQ